MKSIVPLVAATVLIFASSCKPDSFETDTLRPLAKLSTSDISAVSDMKQIADDIFPISAEILDNGTIVSDKEYRWSSPDTNFVYISVWVTEGSHYATGLFEERKSYYAELSKDKIEEYLDLTPVAGNKSYNNGKAFIRDNLIVKVKTSEKYAPLIPEIAKDVDAKILNSGNFFASRQVIPTIKEFKLKENPIHKDTIISYSLDATEPNDRAITYLMFFEDRSTKGITFKNGGLYYDSKIADPSKVKIGLTLIAISEFGFCADSTIYFQVLK